MLTKKGLDTLGSAINFGNLLGYSSFTYFNSHIAVSSKILSKVAIPITFSFHLIYLCYTTTKLVTSFFTKSTSNLNYSQLFWLGVYSTGQFWGLGAMVLVWIRRHETVCFFNSIVELSKNMTATSRFKVKVINSRLQKHLDTQQFQVRYFQSCVVFVAFCSTMMFVVNPHQLQFAYSSISQSPSESYPAWFPDLIFFIILEYYHKLSLQSVIVIETQSILVMYIIFSSWTLSQIQLNSKEQGNLKEDMKNYKMIYILSKLYKESAGYTLSLMFLSFGMIWMFGTIGMIRLYNVVDIFDYAILCVISFSGGTVLLGIIHFCGNIPMKCRMLLTFLRHNYNANDTSSRERKFLLKTAQSMQIFGVRCEPIRLLKHNAIYLYFGSLINMIVTFLVAHTELGKI